MNILLHPDPRLRQVCHPVVEFDAALRALADDLLATMRAANGIGLAAPQIGVMQRIFVMDCITDEPTVVINPRIVWASDELATRNEGCLSIPGAYANITRPAALRMKWRDVDGSRVERLFAGLYAACAQHELDHLNGRLFIDYLSRQARRRIELNSSMRRSAK